MPPDNAANNPGRLTLEKLLRGASFVFLCRVAGAGLTFAAQLLLARWLGAEQLGHYVFAFAVCMLLSTVSGLGLPAAAIRFIGIALAENRNDYIRGYARRSAQVTFVTGLAIAAVGVAVVVNMPEGIGAARAGALTVALVAVVVYGQLLTRGSLATGLSWFPRGLMPNMVIRPMLFIALLAGTWLASVPLDATRAMTLQFGAIIATAVIQWVLVANALRREYPAKESSYETEQWLRTGAPLLFLTLSQNYALELHMFLAGLYLPATELGVFAIGTRVAGLIAFGLIAVDAVSMPAVSRLHAEGDRKQLQAVITRAARLRFVASMLGFVVLTALGRPVLSLFGEEFVAGYVPLVLLAASYALSSFFGPVARVLSVTGHQNVCFTIILCTMVALVAGFPIAILRMGMNGAALVVLAATVAQSAWMYVTLLRREALHASVLGRFGAAPAAG